MKILGNILWCCTLGWMLALLALLLGLLMTVTVVGAPIGLGLIEYGKFLFAPMTFEIENKSDYKAMKGEETSDAVSSYELICSIVYIFPFGLLLAACIGIAAILISCTIVGLPIGIALAKTLPFAFNPVGKVCVNATEKEAVRQSKIRKMTGGFNSSPNIHISMNMPNQWGPQNPWNQQPQLGQQPQWNQTPQQPQQPQWNPNPLPSQWNQPNRRPSK
ncbi:MAG: YccF domain-containing protein [Thermoguttaceae bacterium]|nr:YccF domain-containing protein [Thermoguttaceae bacterium]